MVVSLFSSYGPLVLCALVLGVSALPAAPPTEQHRVTLVNNCPSGIPKFLYQEHEVPQGSGVIYGPLKGGVAWMEGYKNCLDSGRNCGTVEFTLINKQTDAGNSHNSVNYSLLKGDALGNHDFQYKMDFQMSGECSLGSGGPCVSEGYCPKAYTGTDTNSGLPSTCLGDDVDVTITFC